VSGLLGGQQEWLVRGRAADCLQFTHGGHSPVRSCAGAGHRSLRRTWLCCSPFNGGTEARRQSPVLRHGIGDPS
jgi:hypothetical protein